MMPEQHMVRVFHDKMGYLAQDKPGPVSPEIAHQRALFLQEEGCTEYLEAVMLDDLVGIADAIGDALYILMGTAVAHGIDIQPIFDAIHRSNMTKDRLDPVTKKGGKGPGYIPPGREIAALLLTQQLGVAVPE